MPPRPAATSTIARCAPTARRWPGSGIALRGFFHPRAGRSFLWDTKNALGLRPLVPSIPDPRHRAIVDGLLDRYEQRVTPAWPRLRSQVIHGDFALDNALLDDRDRVVGIIDFGDIVHSALATDLASSLSSVLRTRDEDDVFRAARLLIDGFQSRVGLEPLELELLADLLAARLCTIVSISAWRVISYPENAEYIQAWDPGSWMLLNLFDRVGMDTVAQELGAERPRVASAELAKRRRQALGSAITALTYSEPVHVQRGEGPWLFDADGRRLLDVYNNVPVVGHCHPRVTEAVVRQTRTLNTHARYLYEPLMDLAERLIAAMPDGSGLDTVVVVNSGSEANDLALADRQGVHRRVGRAGHGLRLSRRDHGDRRGLARGVAGRLPAARRRDGRRRRHHPAGRRDRLPPSAACAIAASRPPRRTSTAGSPATACGLRLPQTSPPWSTAGARRAACSWPTRCRPDMGARATTCGRSRGSGSRPTSSRWASRWATAIRSPR